MLRHGACLWFAAHWLRSPGTAPLMSGLPLCESLLFHGTVVRIDGCSPTLEHTHWVRTPVVTALHRWYCEPPTSLRMSGEVLWFVLVDPKPASAGAAKPATGGTPIQASSFAEVMGPDAGAER